MAKVCFTNIVSANVEHFATLSELSGRSREPYRLEYVLVTIKNVDNPEVALNLWLEEAETSERESGRVLALEYEYAQYYLPGSPRIKLLAICCQDGGEVFFTVAESRQSLHDQLHSMEVGLDTFHAFSKANDLPVLNLSAPLLLQTVSIPKPWGREIWYTGIEERGVSRVTDGLFSVPLSWVLSVAPKRLVANHERQVNLLKILDPLAEEVYGDLYFELHEEKREVYVVTNVDRQAWPDGVGAIRYGFNPEVRRTFSSDEAFKMAYLGVVRDYEDLRSDIDQQLDNYRKAEGIASNDPVPSEVMKRWVSMLPPTVLAQEKKLREEMNCFTSLLPLEEGDVVQVPLLTPHSLQHGVRTIEFQTPVYERMILSFAQKVLTQDHWDTEEALEQAIVGVPPVPELTLLEEGQGYRIEEIVMFEDFQVIRLTISSSSEYLLPKTHHYVLLMVINGAVECQNTSLTKEHAVLLPAVRSDTRLANRSDRESIVLLATPV